MAESLEAESVREILLRFFSAMRDVVEAQGGTVGKYVGDAVVAAFGVPVADLAGTAWRSSLWRSKRVRWLPSRGARRSRWSGSRGAIGCRPPATATPQLKVPNICSLDLVDCGL
jgi:class 3 adenylate cyclase